MTVTGITSPCQEVFTGESGQSSQAARTCPHPVGGFKVKVKNKVKVKVKNKVKVKVKVKSKVKVKVKSGGCLRGEGKPEV